MEDTSATQAEMPTRVPLCRKRISNRDRFVPCVWMNFIGIRGGSPPPGMTVPRGREADSAVACSQQSWHYGIVFAVCVSSCISKSCYWPSGPLGLLVFIQ